MNARRVIGVVALLAVGGIVGGCASVQVKPVSVAQVNDPAISGVRFFQPQPYLLVTEMPTRPTPPMPMMGGMMRPPMGSMRGGPNSCPMMPQRSGGPQCGPGQPMSDRHSGMNGPEGHGHASDMAQKGHHHDMNMAGMMGQPGHHGNMMKNSRNGPMGAGGPMMGHDRNHPRPMRNRMMHRMVPPPPQQVFELQIIYLPDYSHPYVANIKGGLGRSANSIILANGWELLALNVKGHVTEPRPVHAISAAPAMPPHGGMMRRGPMGAMMPGCDMNSGKPGHHKKAQRDGKHWGWHGPRGDHGNMMMHPMMMPRHAAMAMGLQPGLYRFVFNAKTGKLNGLRRVKLLKPHHWNNPEGMMKWKNSKHHDHDSMPMKSSASDPAGQ